MLCISSSTFYLAIVMPALWMGCISMGLVNGIMGSTQAFLAINVGVSRQTINFIWASGAVGNIVAAIFTAYVFKRFITDNRYKLCFLGLNVIASGCCIVSLPWINSFALLLFTYFCSAVTIGNFNTAGHSLMVFMLGPVRSRPLLQLLDAFVACGLVLGSVLISPFLPETSDLSCSDLPSSGNKEEEASLTWPFLIVGISHAAAALSMLLHAANGLTMPVYSQDKDQGTDSMDIMRKNHINHSRIVIILAFIFYIFSCGLEALFQSQCYTAGHCGPLKLIPHVASELQTTYFLCFMIGRFCAVIISNYVQPSVIIMVSVVVCLLGIILIISIGSWSVGGLFAGVSIVGFSLSFQFASGFSWLAELVDMTGRNSSIVFLGASVGFLVSPPIAGVLEESAGVMALFYQMLGYVILQGIVSLGLIILAKRKIEEIEEK